MPSQIKNYFKLDDNEAIYFNRELWSIKQKSYDILYPELRAREIFPISYDAGPGAETIKYNTFNMVGMGKVVSNYAKDFPDASITGAETISNIKSLGASFRYNIQEIRAAQMVGRPLPERKANAARRAILYLENKLAFFGDPVSGLAGFLTNPNVPSALVANDGIGGLTVWTSKTPDQVIRDVNVAITGVPNLTNGVESVNTAAFPISQYFLMAKTPRSTISDTTILTFLEGVNKGVEFTWLPTELKGTGPGSTDQFFVYRRDPDKLTMEIPQEYEQFDPQLEGMEYKVRVHERFGGIIIYYPLSIAIYYGI